MRTYKHSICTLISSHKKQIFLHIKLLITNYSSNEHFVNNSLFVDKNKFIDQHAFKSQFYRRTGEKIPASKTVNSFSRFIKID